MAKVKGDFSKGSVVKTIFKLAVPIFLAELVHLAYNIVDRVFIARMPGTGTAALTGVGIAFPLISLITAFANLAGMGGAPLMSIARGEGDQEKARRIQETSFTMLIIVGAVLTAVMLIWCPTFLSLMGGDEETLPYALDYFRIYVIGIIPVLIGLGMNPFINGQGFATIGMGTVMIGAILNIILDPLLIYTAGMGVKGAAIATVISQFVSAIWAVGFLVSKRPVIPIKGLRVNGEDAKNIIKLGVTGFTFKATNSIVQTIVNVTLKAWGGPLSTLYIGSMSIINSIRELVMCPCNGVMSGAMPVMSFNYGADKPKRVITAIKTMLVAAIIIASAFWAVMVFAPQWMFGIFTADQELIELGSKCGRIYFISFPLMALQLTGQNTFVSLNFPKFALFFSMLRKIIIVAPLTIILPYLFGLGAMGVFWTETISQIIASVACFSTMYLKIWRKLRRRAAEQELAAQEVAAEV